ncbi:hypothetical protein [uncultured Hoeflea sp.]|uniref:hypothetical protein n=1 Tax=uncultured Hoeflea sp. TaxID=538666 RepID=UPI00260246CB|nr:hypothetical protein [uncultured Hoeflea sp.]
MNIEKPWWQSKTLWGAAVTLFSAVLGLTGLELADGDRASLTELLTSLGAALGGLMALYGRITARARIR